MCHGQNMVYENGGMVIHPILGINTCTVLYTYIYILYKYKNININIYIDISLWERIDDHPHVCISSGILRPKKRPGGVLATLPPVQAARVGAQEVVELQKNRPPNPGRTANPSEVEWSVEFKGKPTGNHGFLHVFYHLMWRCPVN
jgi:hypothetical protein